MRSLVFMIQACTHHSEHRAALSHCSRGPFSLRKVSKFWFFGVFFLETRPDMRWHFSPHEPRHLVASPAQRGVPHSTLANPSETNASVGERRPLKCQTILPAPSSIPSTGLHRRPLLTGGTCLRISSLIHEGGGGAWKRGRDTSSSRSFAPPLIYSEKHDYIATEL